MPIQFSRRTLVAMLGGTVVNPKTAAWGHDLRPGDPSYRFREYEDIVNRNAQVKQCLSVAEYRECHRIR
jgi:hypothetical protein